MTIFAATACGKKKDNAGAGSDQASASDTTGSASGTGSASASDTGSASGTATASGSASGSASDQPQVNVAPPPAIDTANMAHKAGNCPSTVAGAATTMELAKDGKGVVLAIASKEKDAVWAIQTRAKHLLEVQNAPDSKVEHTGKGTGGGSGGVCPVVTKDTKVTVENTTDGVKVTLVPTGKLTIDALQADVDQRIKKSATLTEEVVSTPPAGSGKSEAGTGGGAGKHGGNRTGKGDGSGPRNGTGGGTGGGSGKRTEQ
ncbi:MAG TPA: hypothetical protein VL463_23510 [Kofleriaceae bacterium]|nr:hypothetical protein [Kofleriaceae bacterium]